MMRDKKDYVMNVVREDLRQMVGEEMRKVMKEEIEIVQDDHVTKYPKMSTPTQMSKFQLAPPHLNGPKNGRQAVAAGLKSPKLVTCRLCNWGVAGQTWGIRNT